MKPRKLKIKGLNSFIDMQTIDFKALTDRGLFGIFGPTGSGKSTILDAITLSLYGNISRGNDEFINTCSNDLYVSFEFEAFSNGKRRIFIADRMIKRDKNSKYKTYSAKLVKKGETDIIVAEGAREVLKEVQSIIGLTLDDFTRSVVLPQGKFSEFLKLSGKERRDMLERIFGLERFGNKLLQKIRKSRNKNLSKIENLQGEMKYFSNISLENYKEIKSKLKKILLEEKDIRENKEKMDLEYEKWEGISKLTEELKQYLKREEQLELQLEDFKDKKSKIERAKKALKVDPYIKQTFETRKKVKETEISLQSFICELEKEKIKLKDIEEKYDESVKFKDINLPKFIKKQADLNQANEIVSNLESIKIDRDKLEKEYSKYKIKNKSLNETLKEIICNKNELMKKLFLKENQFASNKVDSDYRQRVQETYEKEQKYEELNLNKNEISNKISNKISNIEKCNDKYTKIVEKNKKQQNELNIIKEEKKKLFNNIPGDETSLIKLQKEIFSIKEKLNDLKNKFEKKNELLKVKKSLQEEKKSKKSEIQKINFDIKNYEKKSNDLESSIKKLQEEKIAQILVESIEEGKPCPVCGSLHHPVLAKKIDKNKLEDKNQCKKSIDESLEKLYSKQRQVEIDLAKIENDENNININLKEIGCIQKDVVEKYENKFNKKENDFENLKETIEKWKNKKEETDIKLEDKLKSVNELDKEEIKLYETIKKDRLSLKELKEEENIILDRFKALELEYKSLKEKLNISKVKDELIGIKQKEKVNEILEREIKHIRNNIEKIDEKKEKIDEQRFKISSEISRIVQSGKEKRSIIDQREKEIYKLSEGKNIEKYLNYILNSIKDLEDSTARLKKQLDITKKQNEIICNKKIGEEEKNKNLISLQKEQQEKLNEILMENDFKSLEEVESIVISKEEIEKVEIYLNSYEDERKDVANNIKRIKERLEGKSLDKDKWIEFKEKRINNNKLLDEKIKERATYEKSLEDMKSKLKKLKELKNENEKLQHKKSILNDLESLVQGNKFVEFVAISQLKYIAMEATKRLKDITNDRYSLLLDPKSNFVIRDDNNGGSIRATSTLSGGETFVTSLALALALSSQIQLKGSVPLEFFFLDEGFGTLDTELLEIVITSLEKLRSDKMSIGIISHVEELRNRVPIKLIVSPSKAGEGTKVKIECS